MPRLLHYSRYLRVLDESEHAADRKACKRKPPGPPKSRAHAIQAARNAQLPMLATAVARTLGGDASNSSRP